MPNTENIFQIPQKYRKLENIHILLWLVKDLCWVMLWKPLGLLMIIPTVGAAFVIAWQTRKIFSELMHNVAVVFWILANAFWMVTEFFFERDDLRYYAAIPFSLGLLVILYHYISEFLKRKEG